MADEEFEVDGKALSSLRVVDLKQELEKRCLSKSGSKKDLVERLKTQLVLERLHESTPDEGHVPNLKLQDEIAEPNDVIKEYLAKQQKIFTIQKEARRRVELEEQQVVEGSEASAGDTSQEEEEQEQSVLQKEADITEPSSSSINTISSGPKLEADQPLSSDCVNDVSALVADETKSPSVKEIDYAIAGEPMQIESVEEAQDVSADTETSGKESGLATLADQCRRSPETLEQKSPEIIEVDLAKDREPYKQKDERNVQDPLKRDTCSEDIAGSAAIHSIPSKDVVQSQSDSAKKHVYEVEQSVSSSLPPSEAAPLPSGLLMDSIAGGPDMLKKEDVIAEDKKRMSNTDEDGRDFMEAVAEEDDKNGLERGGGVAGTNGDDDDDGDGKDRSDVRVDRASSSPSSDGGSGGGVVGRGRRELRQHQRSHRDRRRSSSGSRSSSQDSSSGSSRSSSRRSRSRSSSSGSSADSRGGNRRLSKSGSSPAKLPDAKEIYVSNSSPPSEVIAIKDDADDSVVAIMNTEEDLETFVPSSTTASVTAMTEQSCTVLSDSKRMLEVDAQKPEQKQDSPVKSTSGEQPRIQSRKISLSTSKDRGSVDDSGDGTEKRPPKRRKWGGGSAASSVVSKRPSLSISTDSLKGLIPSVKETAPVISLLDNDPVEQRPAVVDKPPVAADSVRIAEKETGNSKREKIVFDSPPTELSKEEVVSEKATKEDGKGKVVLLRMAPVRSAPVTGIAASAATATASTEQSSSPSPARNPPSCIVHIRNLVRPFTLGQLKEQLGQTGQLVDSGFWIDKIKSKCYVTYSTEDQAVATRRALHNAQWPSSNPKRLVVDFATQDELDFHRMLTDPQTATAKPVVAVGNNADRNQVKAARGVVPPQEVAPKATSERDRRRSAKDDREAESSRRSNKEKHETTRSSNAAVGGGRMPVREWDRDKIGERSPGERARSGGRQRGRASSRSRSPQTRVPLKERDRHVQSGNEAALRDRRDRRERRREVVEEEAPAKLLDDLFRKTKATPCIYWLPLTSEQIRAREEQRKQRQVDREKRWREQQATGPVSTEAAASASAATSGDHNSNAGKSKRSDRENRDGSRSRRQSDGTGHSRYKRR